MSLCVHVLACAQIRRSVYVCWALLQPYRPLSGVHLFLYVHVCLCPHPLWEVKGCNPQRPETAEHGEDGQAEVVSWRDDYEVVLALTVTGAIRLHREQQFRSKYTHILCHFFVCLTWVLSLEDGRWWLGVSFMCIKNLHSQDKVWNRTKIWLFILSHKCKSDGSPPFLSKQVQINFIF